jgi:hypothetical protein
MRTSLREEPAGAGPSALKPYPFLRAAACVTGGLLLQPQPPLAAPIAALGRSIHWCAPRQPLGRAPRRPLPHLPQELALLPRSLPCPPLRALCRRHWQAAQQLQPRALLGARRHLGLALLQLAAAGRSGDHRKGRQQRRPQHAACSARGGEGATPHRGARRWRGRRRSISCTSAPAALALEPGLRTDRPPPWPPASAATSRAAAVLAACAARGSSPARPAPALDAAGSPTCHAELQHRARYEGSGLALAADVGRRRQRLKDIRGVPRVLPRAARGSAAVIVAVKVRARICRVIVARRATRQWRRGARRRRVRAARQAATGRRAARAGGQAWRRAARRTGRRRARRMGCAQLHERASLQGDAVPRAACIGLGPSRFALRFWTARFLVAIANVSPF